MKETYSTSASSSSEDSIVSASVPARSLGILLIIEGLLALAPMAILGPAIGWPASLDNPPGEQLTAIAREPGAVIAGYGVYLLYSILIAPVMILLATRLHGGLTSAWGVSVAAFATLSTLARSIGILRWLTVMPMLASAHAVAEPEKREEIERLFDALNNYGGGIGEVLGVSLFMTLAVGTLAAGLLRGDGLPLWLGYFGTITAIALGLLLVPTFGGPEVMPVAVAVSILSLWMLSAGFHLVARRRSFPASKV